MHLRRSYHLNPPLIYRSVRAVLVQWCSRRSVRAALSTRDRQAGRWMPVPYVLIRRGVPLQREPVEHARTYWERLGCRDSRPMV